MSEKEEITYKYTGMTGKRDSRIFYAMRGEQVLGQYYGWFDERNRAWKLYRFYGQDKFSPLRVTIAPSMIDWRRL